MPAAEPDAERPRAPAERFEIPSLNGIRAVSILIVFLSHAGLGHIVPGGLGVTIFFFLSGYLITTLMRLEFEKTRTVSLPKFYLRRAFRILPAFYLVLAGAVAMVLLSGREVSWPTVAALALHLGNYWMLAGGGPAPDGTGVYWSLAVEEHFYLLFPALFLLLRWWTPSPLRRAAVLWALCAVVLAWRCALVYGLQAGEYRTYLGSDTRIDLMLFGCALAIFGNPALDRPAIPERLWTRLLLPLAAAGLVASLLVRDPGFRETFRYTLQGLCLIPIFVVAIRRPAWGPFAALNWNWVSFLGVLSYGFYLVHAVVLAALHPAGHGPPPAAPADAASAGPAPPGPAAAIALGLAGFALSVLLAWLLYSAVEKPLGRLRRRLE